MASERQAPDPSSPRFPKMLWGTGGAVKRKVVRKKPPEGSIGWGQPIEPCAAG